VIPGFVIAWLTFPGVIVHEFGHFLFCRLRGVPVFDVRFLRLGNPAGYVVHGPTKDFTSVFLICVGPLLVNTVLCLLICLPTYLPFKVFGQETPLNFLVLWLGVSIGMHAFPSTQDATNLWHQAVKEARHRNLLAIFSIPLVGLIFIANLLSIVWFDYLYGVAVGIGIPSLLFR
jgi:hypothetical protein